MLNTRIESLQNMVKEQHDQITRLSQQTDKAYGQVQTMAVKVIEGASQLQLLSSLQQLSGEAMRRPAPEK